jgi:voltage-gated potassium channel
MSIFKKSIKVNSALQLVVCFVLLFIVPSLPKEFQFISYFITLIALVLISAFLIEKHNKKYVRVALGIITIRIINHNFGFDNIVMVLDLLTVFLFIWIALLLIKQVMLKEAGIEMILEAIAGYLLLGIALTLVMGIILILAPNSFSLSGVFLESGPLQFSTNSYYVFITYTTVGYGDIIPVSDIARAFAKLTALSGQLYISVVIAILIGKYIQTK